MAENEKWPPPPQDVTILGCTVEEIRVIKSALSNEATRNHEKHTDRPGMGWDKRARMAQNLSERIP